MLTKVFEGDEVKTYDRAKNFTVTTRDVANIHDVHALLTDLEKRRHKCVIRGAFVGDARAQELVRPTGPGLYPRENRLFPDVPHHWAMFDIDKYEFPADWTWEMAIAMFINEHLPEPFSEATYHYTLTSSCGRVPGVLKCRLVFWLQDAYTSEHLKAWAEAEKLPVDASLFRQVQVHYTAAPVFRDGAVDPIPRGKRSGLVQGELDVVPLFIDPMVVLRPETALREAAKVAPDPTLKRGWIGAFCRAYSPADVVDQFLTDVFEWEGGADGLSTQRRLNFRLGSGAAGGAFITDDGHYIGNMHASDPFNGHPANSFDLVRHYKFGHLDENVAEGTAVHQLPSFRAMNAFCQDDENVRKEHMRSMVTADELDDGETDIGIPRSEEKLTNGAPPVDRPPAPPPDLEPEDDADWAAELRLHPDTGAIMPEQRNVELIILNHPRLKGRLKYNIFADILEVTKKVPWDRTDNASGFNLDTDGACLKSWLERDLSPPNTPREQRMGFHRTNVPMELIQNAIRAVLGKIVYHPVRDYFDGLIWDGVPRIGTLMQRIAGVEEDYVSWVMMKALVASVRRIYKPGTPYDTMPVFYGNQGNLKSTFLRTLCPNPGWFGDDMPNVMHDKDAKEYMQGKLIIEMQELAAARGREKEEHLKSTLSTNVDRYRPAYARSSINRPRQCVFFGTTNREEYATDNTGGRRTPPIIVDQRIDLEMLEAERDQLWAEAVYHEAKDYSIWFSPEELKFILEKVSEHTDDGGVTELSGIIEAFLDSEVPDDYLGVGMSDTMIRRSKTCIKEIEAELMRRHIDKPFGGWSNGIKAAMRKLSGPGENAWVKLHKAHKQRFGLWGTQMAYMRRYEAESRGWVKREAKP